MYPRWVSFLVAAILMLVPGWRSGALQLTILRTLIGAFFRVRVPCDFSRKYKSQNKKKTKKIRTLFEPPRRRKRYKTKALMTATMVLHAL